MIRWMRVVVGSGDLVAGVGTNAPTLRDYRLEAGVHPIPPEATAAAKKEAKIHKAMFKHLMS